MGATAVLIWLFTATWIIDAFTGGNVVIAVALLASGAVQQAETADTADVSEFAS